MSITESKLYHEKALEGDMGYRPSADYKGLNK